ncbi:anthrone oxygenase family protein [Streptomyces sp. NPDC091292]|uniref:anthrone oxygenase family protein n=1 Tax=Streptomyces sp. NPDC091292 TaxID=3365991 RepID=UPI00382A3383
MNPQTRPAARVARWAGLVAGLFSGLFAGFLVAVLVLELSLRSFDRHVYTQVRHVELDSLDKLAAVTLLPALIATALLVGARMFKAGERTPWSALTALVLLVGVLVLTLVVNMPVNSDQLDWTVQAPPADWATVRDRWQIAHGVRTGAAVLAFGALIAHLAHVARSPRP